MKINTYTYEKPSRKLVILCPSSLHEFIHELMCLASFRLTARTSLSRITAGHRDDTVIILPSFSDFIGGFKSSPLITHKDCTQVIRSHMARIEAAIDMIFERYEACRASCAVFMSDMINQNPQVLLNYTELYCANETRVELEPEHYVRLSRLYHHQPAPPLLVSRLIECLDANSRFDTMKRLACEPRYVTEPHYRKDPPLLSVIIPCYNQGEFLTASVSSLLSYDLAYLEVIIIDDGSDDCLTIKTLKYIEDSFPEIRVIHQENKGVSVARNSAISLARAKYILPLDADNQLFGSYIENAIEILEHHDDIAMVYSDCIKRKEESATVEYEYYVAGPVEIPRLLTFNYIDTCAVFRKSMWSNIGGFDEGVLMNRVGLEDWEFWVNALEHGWKFHYLPGFNFEYRIRRESRNSSSDDPGKRLALIGYIIEKHPQIYREYQVKTMQYLHQEFIRLYNGYHNLLDVYNSTLLRRARDWFFRK